MPILVCRRCLIASLRYIEDIYFFEVNTKYISSSVLKTSEFSRVRSTSENFDIFNSRDEIYLVFTKRSKFSFYFILFRRFTVNRVTVFRTKRQKIVCDRIYLDQL